MSCQWPKTDFKDTTHHQKKKKKMKTKTRTEKQNADTSTNQKNQHKLLDLVDFGFYLLFFFQFILGGPFDRRNYDANLWKLRN